MASKVTKPGGLYVFRKKGHFENGPHLKFIPCRVDSGLNIGPRNLN